MGSDSRRTHIVPPDANEVYLFGSVDSDLDTNPKQVVVYGSLRQM